MKKNKLLIPLIIAIVIIIFETIAIFYLNASKIVYHCEQCEICEECETSKENSTDEVFTIEDGENNTIDENY